MLELSLLVTQIQMQVLDTCTLSPVRGRANPKPCGSDIGSLSATCFRVSGGGGSTKEDPTLRGLFMVAFEQRALVDRNLFLSLNPKGPKYLKGQKHGFCSSNFPYGLVSIPCMGTLDPLGKP